MNPNVLFAIVPVALAVTFLAMILIRRVAGPTARITVDGTELRLRLDVVDKVLALHGDIRVPLARVQKVEVVDGPWTSLRGFRALGTSVPGVSYGTRRHTGGRDFVALAGRGPAVAITVGDAAPFQRLVVSVPDPIATAALIPTAVA